MRGTCCFIFNFHLSFFQAQKCGIVESILNWVRFKTMEKMQDQCHKSKRTKLKGIPKLDDANLAGWFASEITMKIRI